MLPYIFATVVRKFVSNTCQKSGHTVVRLRAKVVEEQYSCITTILLKSCHNLIGLHLAKLMIS